jgi:hypothetical protein
MTRALIAVGAGPPILSPAPPFEVMAMPGDVVFDDDPLIFGTHEIPADVRARFGLITRDPLCRFTETDAEEPTNRPFTHDTEIYAALGYDRAP